MADPTDERSDNATRLQELIAAHGEVLQVGMLLDGILPRIARIAMEVTRAEFAAISILAPDGAPEQLVHVGVDPEIEDGIASAPLEPALLEVFGEAPRAVRIADLAEAPEAAALRALHPSMRAFLGAPIRISGTTFGHLILLHGIPDWFRAHDEGALLALATTSGIAIDHAKLLSENARRVRLSQSTAEVSAALVAENADDALPLIAERVMELVDADSVSIVRLLNEDTFLVELSRGHGGAKLEGETYPRAGSYSGQAIESRQPVLSEDDGGFGAHVGLGPMIVAPLAATGEPTAALVASRVRAGRTFDEDDLNVLADFAGQAAVALELARGRADRERLHLLEDRARIARDLHDHVIQRLFAAGLTLQTVTGRIADESARSAVEAQVDALDTAIGEIRTAIFAMTAERADRPTLRHRVIDAIGSLAAGLPIAPQLSFGGAVDLLVPVELHDDVLAVVREGLANAIRHAKPKETRVEILAGEDEVVVEVSDDGVGMPAEPSQRSGTRNLAERAESWQGTMRIEPREPRGTRLVWRAPYPEGSRARPERE